MLRQFEADLWAAATWLRWAAEDHTLMTVYVLFLVNQFLMAPHLSVLGWAAWAVRRLRHGRYGD